MPFLADMYRALFRFGVFNAMQSSCFDMVRKQAPQRGRCHLWLSQIMKSDENVVSEIATFCLCFGLWTQHIL